MDDELRKRVLMEWQNRKKEMITHPYLQEKVEWGWCHMCRRCFWHDILEEI